MQIATSTPPKPLIHAAGCPCCQDRRVAVTPAETADSGYLETDEQLRARIDALPVKPEEITDVLYHAECYDGQGARFAAETARGSQVRYHAVAYKQEPPALPADAKVALVDFSYPREQMLQLQSKVAGVVVLDHHEKARQQLEGLPGVVFEQERAGAGLAWAYFHPNETEPELLRYVEDRDLWKFHLPKSQEVSAALASYPMDTKVWSGLQVSDLQVEGKAILRYKQQLVDGAVKRAFWGSLDGHRVPFATCSPELRSEVGHELLEKFAEAPFAAIFYVNDQGGKEWSLRGREGGMDVNEIAKKFGGGGHKAAAGFRDPGPPLPTELNPPAASSATTGM